MKHYRVLGFFCFLLLWQAVEAMPHQEYEAYLWRQGMLNNVTKQSLTACGSSIKLLTQYILFTEAALRNTKNEEHSIRIHQKLTIIEFKAAVQNFKRGLTAYKKAMVLFKKSQTAYQRLRRSVSAARDDSLPRYRKMVRKTLRDTQKIYNDALAQMVIGNRYFNAGNRVYNGGTQIHARKKLDDDESLPKRRAFHRWPKSH